MIFNSKNYEPSERFIEVGKRINATYRQIMESTECEGCWETTFQVCSMLGRFAQLCDDKDSCPSHLIGEFRCISDATNLPIHPMHPSLYSLIQGLIKDGDIPRTVFPDFDMSCPYFAREDRSKDLAYSADKESLAWRFELPIDQYEEMVRNTVCINPCTGGAK